MAQAKPPAERPLSPHLEIYRLSITMAMSIIHRITGGALYVGTILLVIYLLALASGPEAYAAAGAFFGSFFGRLILFGYTWALMHHMLGGIRHFIWDMGAGLEPGVRQSIATATLAGSLGLTAAIWLIVAIR